MEHLFRFDRNTISSSATWDEEKAPGESKRNSEAAKRQAVIGNLPANVEHRGTLGDQGNHCARLSPPLPLQTHLLGQEREQNLV